jgi:outer membrane receptor protein involved in Fe transport
MAIRSARSRKRDLAYRALLPLCGGAALIAAPGVAPAQTAKQATLEEVVVTARKRAESLQDVPVAVVPITQAQLQNNIATDLTKLGELAPQVVIGRGVSGTGASLTIRGISSTSTDSGLDQSVSISMDGVPLSRGRVIGATLFDMQQVEVLQGPQALFFGKNSPAGVISMHSADPTSRFEAYAKAGYEFVADERFLEAAVSGPLTETLKARLAMRYDHMKGWIRNTSQSSPNPFQPFAPMPGATNGPRQPQGSDLAGRLTLVWPPDDTFEANLKLLLDRQKLNAHDAYTEAYCINGVTTQKELGVPVPYADCAKDRRKAVTAIPPQFAANYPFANGGEPYSRSAFGLGSLNLTKRLDQVTLTSTTGYYDQQIGGMYNADYSQYAQIFDVERERYKLFTQELRLNTEFAGPVNLMVGAYFETADRHFYNSPDILHAFNPATANYNTNTQVSDSRNRSWSAFAQVRWKITPDLELAGGARYTKDSKRSTFVNIVNNLATATGRSLYAQDVPLTAHYRGDNVSPEVTLTWKPTRDQTLYAAYKTGYKSGGVSDQALLPANATPDSTLFGPEKTKGFEAGYKADLLDRTLRVDVTAYRYRYNGLQVTSFDVVRFVYRVGNAASARTSGVTATAQWLATDRLTFNGSLGYNIAKYLSFPGAQCFAGQTAAQGCVGGKQDLAGKCLNRAPKLTYSLGADYRADLSGWTADMSVDAAYSSSYQTATDYAPGGLQKAFWRLNAALRLSPPNDRYEVALIGRNLTDSYYLVYAFNRPLGTTDEYVGVFNRPREVVLQAMLKF